MKRLACFIILIMVVLSLMACTTTVEEQVQLTGCFINESGELVVQYSNGQNEVLGPVCGQNGRDGKNGANGKDGLNGTNGKDGSDGKTPELSISVDGYWVIDGIKTNTLAQGPAGKDGAVVEVEIPTYVKQSAVDLNGLPVIQLSENLYEITLTASEYSSVKTNIYNKLFTMTNIYVSDSYEGSADVFRRGSLTTKPGYIIKKLSLVCTDKMAPATLFDAEYNVLNSKDINTYASGYKFEYSDLNQEQITITFNDTEVGLQEYYGAEIIKIVFEVRN